MLQITLDDQVLTVYGRRWANMEKTLLLHDDLTGYSGIFSGQQEVKFEEKVTPADGALLWEITATLPAGKAGRSISLEKIIPPPENIDFANLHCWNCSILSGVNRFDKVVASCN